MTGVEVQVSGANLYKRRVITSCSHDNEAAHMIVWLLVLRVDHVHIGWFTCVSGVLHGEWPHSLTFETTTSY